ncbi:MAG TPA: cytochrome c peroxidase [Syntrophales bacterium]|nr:cytochrome c peroxidase [Syntrophales bacterium]
MNCYRFSRQLVCSLVLLTMFIWGSFIGCGCNATPATESTKEYTGTNLLVRLNFKPLSDKMPNSHNDTPALIDLGRKLFFEKRISMNKSRSCNNCHRLDHKGAGVDNQPTSKGARGISGKRNSPTVLNAGFQVAQFWDGRAADLVEQAKGALTSPTEMALRSEKDVTSRLNRSADYRKRFALAFPGQAEPVTFDNVARAIAAFERTLITPSRFDRYLNGEEEAISINEKAGLDRFVETGCIECHNGKTVGGGSLQKLGVYHPYEYNSDTGRYKITGLKEDRFVFKVCMLRNVTLTSPYFHDGRISTLSEAVRQMAWMQLDIELAPHEIDDIIRFLHTLEA